jgi:hypothetical protein
LRSGREGKYDAAFLVACYRQGFQFLTWLYRLSQGRNSIHVALPAGWRVACAAIPGTSRVQGTFGAECVVVPSQRNSGMAPVLHLGHAA